MPLQVIIASSDCTECDKDDRRKYRVYTLLAPDTTTTEQRVIDRMATIQEKYPEHQLQIDAKQLGVLHITFAKVTRTVDADMLMLQAIASGSNSRLVTAG